MKKKLLALFLCCALSFGLVTAANTYLDQAQGRVDAQACRLAADVIEEHAFVPEGADAQA